MSKQQYYIYLPEDIWCVAKQLSELQLKHIVYDKYGKLRPEQERIDLLNEYVRKWRYGRI